jgi:hypothetical protein
VNVWCRACNRGDLPETTGPGGVDTTANDHLQLWHPGEWFEADWTDDGITLVPCLNPKGEG